MRTSFGNPVGAKRSGSRQTSARGDRANAADSGRNETGRNFGKFRYTIGRNSGEFRYAIGFRYAMGLIGSVFCVAALVANSPSAQADVKPFKITGAGVGPLGLPLPGQDPRPHWIVGQATHLGRHTGAGTVGTDPNNLVFHPDGRITGEFGSGEPFVFVGANGDILSCHYGRTAFGASTPGTFELVPAGAPGMYVALFIAEFVPQPGECTGKFAGVTGHWVMYAVTEPFLLGSTEPIDYSWEGQGWLEFVEEE